MRGAENPQVMAFCGKWGGLYNRRGVKLGEGRLIVGFHGFRRS